MIRRRWAVTCLAILISAALSADQRADRYAGRPLTDVLQDLSSQGLKIVFSNRVVRSEMTVLTEPTSRSPRAMLRELLAPHGLKVIEGPGGTLLVVKAPARKSRAAPPPPKTGRLEVDLRRLDDHRPLRASVVQMRGWLGQAVVSAKGSVVIPGISPGIYNIEVFVPGLAGPSIHTFSVEAGETVELVLDITELPGGSHFDKTLLPPLTLVLTEGARFRETVKVSAQSEPVPAGPSEMDVRPSEVMSIAGAGDNVFRALQTLPGVEGANEFDSRLSVRGGAPDQNLTVIDGVEIYNPYRQRGFASALNPEMMESFRLSTGGFDVRYGDRLSSLLVVQNRHGTHAHALKGAASMSVLDAGLILEGKLPGAPNGSWLVAGRHFFYDVVAGSLITYVPSFSDLQAKISIEPRPGKRLSFSGVLSRERANGREHDPEFEVARMRTKDNNALASLSFESNLGSRVSTRSVASFYRFTHFGDLQGSLATDARAANGFFYEGTKLVNIVFNREVDTRDWSLRQELVAQLGKRQLLETGFELHRLHTRWGWHVEGDRSASSFNQTMPSLYGLPGQSLPTLLDSNRTYTRTGVWIQDRIYASSRIAPRVGVRVDRSGANRETTLSPRASVSIEIDDVTRVRAAAGLYYQSPGYEKLFLSDYFVDLSESGRLGLKSERSFHTVLGMERDLTEGVTARIEGYYKRYSDLIVGRLETMEERRDRLGRYDFSIFHDEIPSEPQITTYPANDARGTAYGLDLFVTKKAVTPRTRLTGWASYTYGVAERQAYGHSFPFDYDRRHSFSIVGKYRMGPAIEISSTARIASGFPWTPPVGVRVAAEQDFQDADFDGNVHELIPATDSMGQLLYTHDVGGFSNLNSARLPVYARIDARLTYWPQGRQGRWSLYLDAINIFNRENAGRIRCRFAPNPNGDRPLFMQEREYAVPFIVLLGIRFRF